MFQAIATCATHHPKYQTDAATWYNNYPLPFRTVDVMWQWMLAAHGLGVIQRYNLVLATLLETFATGAATGPPRTFLYYAVGDEFDSQDEEKEASKLTSKLTTTEASLARSRSILRNLMLPEEHALDGLQNAVVQDCVSKQDYSGGMNYLLHMQFNKLSQRLPYLTGSKSKFETGKNMIMDLAQVLRVQQRQREEAAAAAAAAAVAAVEEDRSVKRRRGEGGNEENDTCNSKVFMEMEDEEDEFERMLRESLLKGQ